MANKASLKNQRQIWPKVGTSRRKRCAFCFAQAKRAAKRIRFGWRKLSQKPNGQCTLGQRNRPKRGEWEKRKKLFSPHGPPDLIKVLAVLPRESGRFGKKPENGQRRIVRQQPGNPEKAFSGDAGSLYPAEKQPGRSGKAQKGEDAPQIIGNAAKKNDRYQKSRQGGQNPAGIENKPLD